MARSTSRCSEQLAALKDPKVWSYCQYYSIVFGGYVALSLWMTKYYITEYGFDIQHGGAAGRRLLACPAACCARSAAGSPTSTARTRVTWWVLWVALVCLFFLSYPQTDFTIQTVDGPKTFHIGLNVVRCSPSCMFTHGHRLGDRQGLGVQVHLRRLSAQHRRGFRRGRPGRRHGRLRPADHVRRAGGPDRRPLHRLHADVRRRLGVADVDVLDRGACRSAAATGSKRCTYGRAT